MSLQTLQEALADQIRSELVPLLEGIQVEPVMALSPSPDPVAIDVYPAQQDPAVGGFGFGNYDYLVDVRARINTPDNEAAQLVLLSLYDSRSATSLLQAIMADTTLNGAAENVAPESGPTAFGVFPDASGTAAFMGFTITLRIIPSEAEVVLAGFGVGGYGEEDYGD